MIAITRIAKVTAREGHWLEVVLDNGTIIILNMAARLNNIRFMALADPAVFQTASTDGLFIRWGNKVEISLNEVFHLVQK